MSILVLFIMFRFFVKWSILMSLLVAIISGPLLVIILYIMFYDTIVGITFDYSSYPEVEGKTYVIQDISDLLIDEYGGIGNNKGYLLVRGFCPEVVNVKDQCEKIPSGTKIKVIKQKLQGGISGLYIYYYLSIPCLNKKITYPYVTSLNDCKTDSEYYSPEDCIFLNKTYMIETSEDVNEC